MPQLSHFLTPFQRQLLEQALEEVKNPIYEQRIQIMLMVDEGQSQSQICKILGCAHVTARYWIGLARAGNAHQWRETPVGRPKQVDQNFCDRLQTLVCQSPRALGYPFQRWTGRWLSKHLAQETGIEISDRRINGLLKEMGLSTLQEPTVIQAAHQIQICDLTTTAKPVDYSISLFNLPKSS